MSIASYGHGLCIVGHLWLYLSSIPIEILWGWFICIETFESEKIHVRLTKQILVDLLSNTVQKNKPIQYLVVLAPVPSGKHFKILNSTI